MKLVAFDTETEAIKHCPAPRLVCLSYCYEGGEPQLVKYDKALEVFQGFLDEGCEIVGHNIAFDFGVMCAHEPALIPEVFDLYTDDRVHDTWIRQLLKHVAEGTLHKNKGRVGLGDLAQLYLGVTLDKGADSWRKRYGELLNVPLPLWPEAASHYAKEDARSTFLVFEAQNRIAITDSGESGLPVRWPPADASLQYKAAWALHLMSVWGVRTESVAVKQLHAELLGQENELFGELLDAGFLRRMNKHRISRNVNKVKEIIEDRLGEAAPRTDKGNVKTDAQTLADLDDPELEHLVEYSRVQKLLTTYVPILEAGSEHNIHARFGVLVDSGRTSCRSPNLQNLPRGTKVRECFVPRPGYVYVACDYDTAELRALAQICYSTFNRPAWKKKYKHDHKRELTFGLRDAFLNGEDPHLGLGASLLGITYNAALDLKERGDQRVKEARQLAKVANFGYPGGLGAGAFKDYASGYGLELSRAQAEELRDAWFKRWPEMELYFLRAAAIADGNKELVHHKSSRIHGGLRFTQCANAQFQGLVADFAKDALFHVARACYVNEESPLFDSRPVAFIHDEILMESPEDKAPEAAEELSRIMNAIGNEWCPDVPITSSAHLMRRWYKNAEPVRDEDGRLIPWEPKT